MKWILAVWFCGISAMADAQVTESLKAIGMENIQCAQTPGVTTVSFENNVYRSTYTGVGKAIDACLGSETKGDLQLVVLENRIPRLCINLPDTLTAAYRNGEISLTQVYQQMGITVDTDPAMKALKNAGQEEVPSAWKVDLVIYPDLFLENNTFDELYTYANAGKIYPGSQKGSMERWENDRTSDTARSHQSEWRDETDKTGNHSSIAGCTLQAQHLRENDGG